MFVIGWIRKLLSLPLQWLGQVAIWTRTGLDVPLLTAAWRVSGDGRIAKMALARLLLLHGIEPTLIQAQIWLRQNPCPEIAAMTGLMAMDLGQLDTAREMLVAGQQLGPDNEGLLELLEWHLAMRSEDNQGVRDLTRRWETRRDLSPGLKRLVLCGGLWDAVMERRFAEVGARARQLLSIEEVPEAHMALWAAALEDGDARAAQFHLQAAKMPPPRKLYYQVFGNAAAGYREEARALLGQLRLSEPNLAAHAQRQLASLGVLA